MASRVTSHSPLLLTLLCYSLLGSASLFYVLGSIWNKKKKSGIRNQVHSLTVFLTILDLISPPPDLNFQFRLIGRQFNNFSFELILLQIPPQNWNFTFGAFCICFVFSS